MKALTRKELYLQAIATGNTENLPTPQTREETYLEAIANGDTALLPDPQTREEVFMKQIAEKIAAERLATTM